MTHTEFPGGLSHPAQLAVVPLVTAADKVTVVPVGKLPVQEDPPLNAQPRPAGELDTVPAPMPDESTVIVGPVLVKQTRFAVIDPVTTAPDEDTPEPSLFVVNEAETSAEPQAWAVAVSRPVALTANICGVFEAQVTWLVISLVTGG
jgi:hypothetical protein